jgi:hypothetical protein
VDRVPKGRIGTKFDSSGKDGQHFWWLVASTKEIAIEFV